MTRCPHGVPLDLDCGDCFEEEAAKEKLEDLGFVVISVDDVTSLGLS